MAWAYYHPARRCRQSEIRPRPVRDYLTGNVTHVRHRPRRAPASPAADDRVHRVAQRDVSRIPRERRTHLAGDVRVPYASVRVSGSA